VADRLLNRTQHPSQTALLDKGDNPEISRFYRRVDFELDTFGKLFACLEGANLDQVSDHCGVRQSVARILAARNLRLGMVERQREKDFGFLSLLHRRIWNIDRGLKKRRRGKSNAGELNREFVNLSCLGDGLFGGVRLAAGKLCC